MIRVSVIHDPGESQRDTADHSEVKYEVSRNAAIESNLSWMKTDGFKIGCFWRQLELESHVSHLHE